MSDLHALLTPIFFRLVRTLCICGEGNSSVGVHMNRIFSGQERRRNPRAETNLLTQVENPADKISFLGRAKNLEENGMLLESSTTCIPMTEVRVQLNLPPFPPGFLVECQGTVVHAQPGKHMGIKFHDLAIEPRIAITKYVLGLSPQTKT